jgi:hypothetical protein
VAYIKILADSSTGKLVWVTFGTWMSFS